MTEGDVLLAALPQSDGHLKRRPVICLRLVPPFNDFLVCGVSSQLHQAAEELDETISQSDGDFVMSGLKAKSLIRLGYLIVLPQRECRGRIGSISEERRIRLLKRLSAFLDPGK